MPLVERGSAEAQALLDWLIVDKKHEAFAKLIGLLDPMPETNEPAFARVKQVYSLLAARLTLG